VWEFGAEHWAEVLRSGSALEDCAVAVGPAALRHGLWAARSACDHSDPADALCRLDSGCLGLVYAVFFFPAISSAAVQGFAETCQGRERFDRTGSGQSR